MGASLLCLLAPMAASSCRVVKFLASLLLDEKFRNQHLLHVIHLLGAGEVRGFEEAVGMWMESWLIANGANRGRK